MSRATQLYLTAADLPAHMCTKFSCHTEIHCPTKKKKSLVRGMNVPDKWAKSFLFSYFNGVLLAS
jgi:hypothetical protein